MFKIPLVLFLFLNLTVHGQIKLDYYTFKNKADSCVFEKNYKDAYIFYNKAVNISDVNPYTVMELVKVSLKLKDYKKTASYLTLAMKKGALLGMLEADSNVLNFVKKDQLWKEKFSKLRQEYLASIPYLEDRTTLLNLLEKDQALRSLLGVIEFKKADSIIFASDTTNMSVILEIVNRIGFPDIQKVGVDGAFATYIILLHTLNNKVHDKENLLTLIPLMRDAVQKLYYLPFWMGIVIDRNRALNKQKQIYGTYWEPVENNKRIIMPIENIKDVDKRRREIGLPPLSNSGKHLGQTVPKDYSHNY